jgi:hypothetical protein
VGLYEAAGIDQRRTTLGSILRKHVSSCFAKLSNGFDSPEAFEKAWLGVFARIKKQSGRDQPPYMNLRPQDLLIQMQSPDIALATFHLIDGDTIDRRSMVLKQYPDGWKIVHIHASNIGSTTR